MKIFKQTIIIIFISSLLLLSCNQGKELFTSTEEGTISLTNDNGVLRWNILQGMNYQVELVEIDGSISTVQTSANNYYNIPDFKPNDRKYRVKACSNSSNHCTDYSNSITIAKNTLTNIRLENGHLSWDAFPGTDYYNVQGNNVDNNVDANNDNYVDIQSGLVQTSLSVSYLKNYRIQACDNTNTCSPYYYYQNNNNTNNNVVAGLVAFLPLEQNADDYSSSGNNGNGDSGINYTNSGAVFTGNQKIVISKSIFGTSNFTHDFTLSFNFNFSNFDGSARLFSFYRDEFRAGYNRSFQVYEMEDNLYIENSVQTKRIYDNLQTNKNYLFTMVFDYAISRVSIYLDGSLVESFVNEDLKLDNLEDLYFGWDQNLQTGNGFKGTIKNIAIYSNALSQYEVSQLYNFAGVPTLTGTSGLNKPTNLTANSITGESRVTLNWQDNSHVEQGYKIDRKIGDGAWTESYSQLDANTITYSDNNLAYGNTYYYRVYAFNGNNSSEKAEQSVEIQLPRYPLYLNSFYNEGNAIWIRENNSNAYSGAITHNQTTCIFDNVFAKNLYFDWKVSSESNYDYLRFYIDGVEQDKISGFVDWNSKSYSFDSPQDRRIKWCYTKDYSVNSNLDKAWIRNVEYSN